MDRVCGPASLNNTEQCATTGRPVGTKYLHEWTCSKQFTPARVELRQWDAAAVIWSAPLAEGERVYKSVLTVGPARWRLYLEATSVARAENAGEWSDQRVSGQRTGCTWTTWGGKSSMDGWHHCRPGCSGTQISPSFTAPTTAGTASRPACWQRPSCYQSHDNAKGATAQMGKNRTSGATGPGGIWRG